jgi:dimethylglycine catabolism B
VTRALPVLTERTKELETCGYCPKLCRAACPVSNAEPRETLIPWGKMTMAWLEVRGDVERTPESAAVSWACSGCLACTERCEHKNPVTATLYAARADHRDLGLAPAAVNSSAERQALRMQQTATRLQELAREPGVARSARTAVLVGCEYLRKSPEVSLAIVRSVVALAGPVRLVFGCCGAPLLFAGDAAGYQAESAALKAELSTAERVIVADPGCASLLGDARTTTLVRLAQEHAARLQRVPELALEPHVRFHDPCALGRGLGQYAEPRSILERALGRPAGEFGWRRERAECSGAGGLLPIAMPQVSERIAARRLAEHTRLGGGTLVTACGASLERFRKSGARVIDIASVICQSLGLRS